MQDARASRRVGSRGGRLVEHVWYGRCVSHRFVSAVTLVLAAAVVLAGCGGDPKVEYRADLRGIGDQVAAALDEIPTDGDQPIEPTQIAALAEDLREAADELDDLDPPDDARAPQKRFVRGLRGVAAALTALARDLKRSPDETAQAERFVEFASDEKIEKAFDDLAGAQEAYAREGYRIFRPAVDVDAPAAATKS